MVFLWDAKYGKSSLYACGFVAVGLDLAAIFAELTIKNPLLLVIANGMLELVFTFIFT